MAEIQLPNKVYNIELLGEELRAALPNKCFGALGRKGLYFAHMADNAAAGDNTTALNVATAHNGAALTATDTLREQIKTVAQSAVGVAYDQLTAAQVRALVAILLWKQGALNNDGTVKPLGQWVK